MAGERKRRDVLHDLCSWSDDDKEPAAATSSNGISIAKASDGLEAQKTATASDALEAPKILSYVAKYDFREEKKAGIVCCIPTAPRNKGLDTITTGKIVTHAEDVVWNMVEKHGGDRCVLKLGICSALAPRWTSYKDAGWKTMCCLMCSESLAVIEMLEATLIAIFKHRTGCKNDNPGGDGGLRKRVHYLVQVGMPVFFMYVVCQNGDALHPIDVPKALWSKACREKHG